MTPVPADTPADAPADTATSDANKKESKLKKLDYRPLWVAGLSLNERAMRAVAEVLCTPEEIKLHRCHHTALVLRWRRLGVKQTLLLCFDPKTKREYYMWVLGCLPSDVYGRPLPGVRVQQSYLAGLIRGLREKGLAQEYVDTFRQHMVEWPRGIIQPKWVPDLLNVTRQVYEAECVRRANLKLSGAS